MVGEAVASVLSQKFADFELIVVDDGSTDGTAGELAGFGSTVRFISTPKRGVSAARNTGVRASGGRYLAFLDSDDLWKAGKLVRQTAFMEEHPQVQICQTEEIWVRNGVRVNPKLVHRKPSGDVFLRSLDLCLVSPSAVMMTRDLFERVGGFDESFPVCEDYDLWLRVSVQEPIPLIPVPLVIKRGGHADQLSRSIWGMDRYRVLTLQKLLRAGLVDPRRAAVLSVLRRKVAVLSNGARKRGKLRDAAKFEAMFAEFELGRTSADERNSRLRQGQGL